MKKVLYLSVAAGLIWFQSCKEIGPKINFGQGVQQGEDTTYTADVEVPQTKKVVAEEFTGVSCPPCPNGHTVMASIKEELNKNIVIIGYHIFNFPQAEPVQKNGEQLSKYDFRTQDATDVGKDIFGGIGAMPVAGFGRVIHNDNIGINTPSWSEAAKVNAGIPTPVNIYITSAYDDVTREAKIKVKLAYTADVNIKQNLTLMITEDSIVDAQKKSLEIIKEYVHEHVLRDIVTPTYGEAIPPKVDPKVPGRVYERNFTVKIDEAWHAEHCHVVAFVNNDDASDRTIVHGEEVKLTGE